MSDGLAVAFAGVLLVGMALAVALRSAPAPNTAMRARPRVEPAHRKPSLLQEVVQFIAFLVLAAVTIAVLGLEGIK